MSTMFDKPGRENTEQALAIAVESARARGLEHIVVASNTGSTVRKLCELECDNLKVVCVTHHVGFREPGLDEMGQETRRELAKLGVELLTTTHALAGVERALRLKLGGIGPAETIAGALRMFGQGVKVCVEIAIMALDAGLIPFGVDVVAVGGTGRGADTACIVRSAHSNSVFDTKVVEILCRPRC